MEEIAIRWEEDTKDRGQPGTVRLVAKHEVPGYHPHRNAEKLLLSLEKSGRESQEPDQKDRPWHLVVREDTSASRTPVISDKFDSPDDAHRAAVDKLQQLQEISKEIGESRSKHDQERENLKERVRDEALGFLERVKFQATDCPYCQGQDSVKTEKISVCAIEADEPYVLKNVPARVCNACGDKTFSQQTVQRTERVKNGEVPKAGDVTMPVYDLEQA